MVESTPIVWTSTDLSQWLVASRDGAGDYRHLRLSEDLDARTAGLQALAGLVREAHRDARERLEAVYGVSLDPLDPSPRPLPQSQNYPDDLDTITLQGYLGEIFAGLVAENYEPHGLRWEVPAFLFRNHASAAQALERQRQLGEPAQSPGRTGDDAVAFRRDDQGHIVEWLYGEAKCSHTHSNTLIRRGHEQLSVDLYLPVDLIQLITILDERGDAAGTDWANALRLLLFKDRAGAPPRADMLVYVCGQLPKREPSWIPTQQPVADYTGGRRLEAVEVHLSDFDEVLLAGYTTHSISR